MLTDIVVIELNQGVVGRQQPIELRRVRRLGRLDEVGDKPGELVACQAQRHSEKADKQERGDAEVNGHDPALVVRYEISAVDISRAEA